LVVEVTSKKTKREDQGKKKSLYERLGIESWSCSIPTGTTFVRGFRVTD
jgi:hypothetical protein